MTRWSTSAGLVIDRLTRLLGDKRGSNHDALVAEAFDQPVEPVSRRPRFVTESQLAVFCRKFGNDLSDRRSGDSELTEIPHLAATDAIGNCYLHYAILTYRFRRRLRYDVSRLTLLV